MKKRLYLLCLSTSITILQACTYVATRPHVVPESIKSHHDIDLCLEKADEFMKGLDTNNLKMEQEQMVITHLSFVDQCLEAIGYQVGKWKMQ